MRAVTSRANLIIWNFGHLSFHLKAPNRPHPWIFSFPTTMAKLAVTFTLLCLFFAFSHARFPLDLPQNDAVIQGAAEILPEADPKVSTTKDNLLPIEKPESDPELKTIEVKLEEIGPKDAIPLTMISFRPVNRHFPRRTFPLMLRHGHRCRHQFMKPWGPRQPRGDVIPYGNDMILSGGDHVIGSDPVLRDGVRQIPARWIKIRHMEPRFHLKHDEEIEWRHHHRHHHGHDLDHDHHKHEDKDKKERENVFLKSFRKFMEHF